MKVFTVFSVCFIALALAQWPCHDTGFNGAISSCSSCNVQGSGFNSDQWFSICTNCTAGFFLNQTACMPCTNNCSMCYSNGACGACQTGFALIKSNYSCMACPSSCRTCSYNEGLNSQVNGPFNCDSCPTGNYYLDSTTQLCVLSTAVGCSGWSAAGCTGCASGYFDSDVTVGVWACTACSANCLSCTSASVCTTCAPGYGLAGGSACVACTPAGCKDCSAAAATCTTCYEYGLLTGGLCPNCTANCGRVGTSAVGCASASMCNSGQCALGYYFTSVAAGTCTACGTNCTTCNDLTGACNACAANNTLNNGLCIPCPGNCSACVALSSSSSSVQCLKCYPGWGLFNNGSCIACPGNCSHCDINGVCTQCSVGSTFALGVETTMAAQGYFQPPNQCQQCPFNCSSCVNSTYCNNNCTKNYVYNATSGLCLSNGAERIFLAGFALLSVLFYFV